MILYFELQNYPIKYKWARFIFVENFEQMEMFAFNQFNFGLSENNTLFAVSVFW